MTDGQTDRRTDRRTECKPIVPSGFTGGGLIINVSGYMQRLYVSGVIFLISLILRDFYCSIRD